MQTEKETATQANAPDNIPVLEYHRPTEGFPIVALNLSHGSDFKLILTEEEKTNGIGYSSEPITPIVPIETDDPALLDDRQNVMNIAAAGCNIASKTIGSDSFVNILTYSYNRIGLFLSNAWCTSEIDVEENEGRLNKFIDKVYPPTGKNVYKSAFRGFNLYDEPKIANLDGEPNKMGLVLSDFYYKIAEKIDSLKGWNPLMHVNLLPIFGIKPNKGETVAEAYQRYLNKYRDEYKPAYYSYDQYPVAQFNPTRCKSNFLSQYGRIRPGGYVQFHERFYRSMQMVADHAKNDGNRPFWAYILSCEHTTGGGYYPAPLEQFMRYEAFTALAYGAKGLCYWRFLQGYDDKNNLAHNSEIYDSEKGVYVKNPDWNDESFLRHPLRDDRKRTPYWYFVRRINREIRKYEHIFLNGSPQTVVHTHTDRLRALANAHYGVEGTLYGKINQTDRDIWGLRPFKSTSIPIIQNIVSKNNGLGVVASHFVVGLKQAALKSEANSVNGLIGEPVIGTIDLFEHYLVIVSHDALDFQDIEIQFKGTRLVNEITPLTSGGDVPSDAIDCSKNPVITRTLPPGGYIIFHWNSQVNKI